MSPEINKDDQNTEYKEPMLVAQIDPMSDKPPHVEFLHFIGRIGIMGLSALICFAFTFLFFGVGINIGRNFFSGESGIVFYAIAGWLGFFIGAGVAIYAWIALGRKLDRWVDYKRGKLPPHRQY